MAFESDDQIAARKQREREVKAAWREWKHSVPLARKLAATLPSANPAPKAIIVTRNRSVDRRRTDWNSWGTPGRRP